MPIFVLDHFCLQMATILKQEENENYNPVQQCLFPNQVFLEVGLSTLPSSQEVCQKMASRSAVEALDLSGSCRQKRISGDSPQEMSLLGHPLKGRPLGSAKLQYYRLKTFKSHCRRINPTPSFQFRLKPGNLSDRGTVVKEEDSYNYERNKGF